MLDGSFLRPYFSKNPAAVEQVRSDATLGPSPTAPTPAQLFGERHSRSTSRTGGHPVLSNTGGFPAISSTGPMRTAGLGLADRVEEAGEHVARVWILTRGQDNIRDLLPGPILPPVIDKEHSSSTPRRNSTLLARPYERPASGCRTRSGSGCTASSASAWADPAAEDL